MNKTILVTGGSGIIGFSIVKYFYEKNYNVVIVGLESKKKISKIKKILNQIKSLIFNVELTKVKNIEKIIKTTIKKFKSIDVLVNCAGIQFVAPIEDYPEKIWRKMIDINLTTPFLMIKSVLPFMRKNKFGRIINISSVNGQAGQYGQVNYCAAKAGIIGMTKAIAQEGARYNITANTVAPGYVDTEMVAAVPQNVLDKIISTIPVGRLGHPEEIARAVAFLAREDSQFVTGSTISINGGHHMY